MSANVGQCTLRPGETCLMCGHTAPKKEPKAKPACHLCGFGFDRSKPWRNFRGKRVHTACVPRAGLTVIEHLPADTMAPKPPAPPVAPTPPLYEPADTKPTPEEEKQIAECLGILREGGRVSVSLFQRRLRLTYVKAVRLVDFMAGLGWLNYDPKSGAAPITVLALPTKEEEFTCPACDYDEAEGGLLRRCKRCAGKLGVARRRAKAQ